MYVNGAIHSPKREGSLEHAIASLICGEMFTYPFRQEGSENEAQKKHGGRRFDLRGRRGTESSEGREAPRAAPRSPKSLAGQGGARGTCGDRGARGGAGCG